MSRSTSARFSAIIRTSSLAGMDSAPAGGITSSPGSGQDDGGSDAYRTPPAPESQDDACEPTLGIARRLPRAARRKDRRRRASGWVTSPDRPEQYRPMPYEAEA